MQRLTREPRSWKANGWAYIGHAAQGFVAGLVLPFIWQPYLFAQYQRCEFEAYWRRNEAGEYMAHDYPSRDIADYTIGYTTGSGITLAAVIGILAIALI